MQVSVLYFLNQFTRQAFHWDISVIKIDAYMFVLHLEVAAYGRVGYDFFVILLPSVLYFITIEHGVLSYVLESRLQTSPNHDILLN